MTDISTSNSQPDPQRPTYQGIVFGYNCQRILIQGDDLKEVRRDTINAAASICLPCDSITWQIDSTDDSFAQFGGVTKKPKASRRRQRAYFTQEDYHLQVWYR